MAAPAGCRLGRDHRAQGVGLPPDLPGNALRRLGGEAGYGGSFIEQYLEPVLYPLGLTPNWQLAMGSGVLALNAALYCYLWWTAPPRRH